MDNNNEDVEKGLKNVGKKVAGVFKSALSLAGPVIIIIAIIIIFVAILYNTILSETSEEVGEHMSNNKVEYDYEGEDSAAIVIDEEQIQELKDVMEELAVSADNLNLTDEEWTKIYAAEVVSKEINRVQEGGHETEGNYYGRVYVKYAGENTDSANLSSMYFVNYDYFEANKDTIDSTKYFSIDDDGLLCVLTTVTTTDANGNVTKTVEVNHIDYQTSLLPYFTPVEFLIDLCLITNNPGFVMALTDKILDETEIYITILNETVTVETTETLTYKIETQNFSGTITYDETNNSYSTDIDDNSVVSNVRRGNRRISR